MAESLNLRSTAPSHRVLLVAKDCELIQFVENSLCYDLASIKTSISKVSNLTEALEFLERRQTDVILLSLQIGDLNILNMVRQIKNHFEDVPIVLIGSSGCESLALEAIKLGAQDCLFKESLDKSRIFPTIQYAIERRKIASDLITLHMKQISASIEHVSEGILLTSSSKKIIFVNKAAEQILWKSSKDLIGKQVPFPCQPGEIVNHKMLTPSGDTVFVEIKTTIVPWDHGHAGFSISIHDVSRHKKIQQELQRTSRLKDEFIAHISHELRTPMNGIVGMTSLIQEHKLPSELQSYVETIRTSGNNMLAIINDLLDLSKIEAEKLELEFCEFNIASLIKETLSIFSQSLLEKGLLLTFEVDECVPEKIIADSGRIRQVIANLVSNAIKATDEGYIKIRIGKLGDSMLEVTVSDTGVGIPVNEQEKLFEPFAKIQAHSNRNSSGTGLGLKISQKIVNLMQGEICYSSEVEHGSIFSFTFKFEFPVGLKTVEVAEKIKPKLLVVTQCESFKNIFSAFLKEHNCSSNFVKSLASPYNDFDAVIYDNPYSKIPDEEIKEIENFITKDHVPMIFIGKPAFSKDKLFKQKVSCFSRYPFDMKALLEFCQNLITDGYRLLPENSNYFLEGNSFSSPSTFNNIKVLVAEDNLINQKVLLAMLDRLGGIQADAVADGFEALEAAKAIPYDIILMDCRMPVMDGYEAAAKIRQISQHYRKIPIIAVSANALKNERIKSNEASMDFHLAKPITIAELKKTLLKFSTSKEAGTIKKNHPNPSLQPELEVISKQTIQSLENISSETQSELLSEVIAIFLDNSPKLINEIEAEFSLSNLSRVSSLAHKLKGSAKNIGAEEMASICEKIELDAEEQSMARIEMQLEQLRKSFARAKDNLELMFPVHKTRSNVLPFSA